jgi:hypothetical protein
MFKSTLYVVLLISTFVCVQSAFTQVYFFNKLEMATGKSPQSLAVGDFNKDGMPHFVVANTADNTVSVFLGKKDGTLTAFSTGAATAPSAIATADFNGDGKLDLAVVLNGANTVEIFTGKGDGTFNSGVSFAVGTGPVARGVGDFMGSPQSYAFFSETFVINKLRNQNY